MDVEPAADPGSVGRELTQRQLLIWTEQQLAPKVPSNNMLMCFAIDGEVNTERFERAFARVVAECDALRTVIREVDGTPRQFVLPAVPRLVDYVDLSEEGRPGAFGEWRDARCTRRIHLDQQLFDCVLVRLGDGRTVWFLCQHHVICDAWSFSLVFRRVADLYAEEDASAYDRRPHSFHRLLDSDLEYRDSDRHARSASFWKERYERPIEPLHPYGMAPTVRRPGARRLSVALGSDRSRAVRELALREDLRATTETLSLSMVFTTALGAFLHRISGNTVVGIGTPVLNRPFRWAKQTVGPFMEVCPLELTVSEDDTFASLHARAVQESATVLLHSRCSVSNPIRNKRFEVMLNFHNATVPDFADMGVHADIRTGLVAMESQPGSDELDCDTTWEAGDCLTLQVLDFGETGEFQLHAEFNTDVFDAALSQRAVEHYLNLLDAMLCDPNGLVSAAPMLSAAEREELLTGPDEGAADPDRERHVLERFRDWVVRDPDRAALSMGRARRDQDLGYGELDSRVRLLAASIREAEVGHEGRVAVCMGRSSDLVVALLAILDAGAVYVPLDPNQPADRIRMILEDAAPSLILTEGALADRVSSSSAPQIHIDAGQWDAQPASTVDGQGPRVSRSGDDLAYVIFTSGSTGRPKGVEIEHRMLSNLMSSMAKRPGLSEVDRLLAITTVAFDISILELILPLTVGASIEIADEPTCRDPVRLAELLDASSVTVMQATPATWQMLVDSGWTNRSGLRVLCGGDVMSRELADSLLDRSSEVWNLYGPTETTIWSTVERVTAGSGPVSIGLPIDRTAVRILTPGRELVPQGVQGELHIGGEGLARGYHGRPDLTAERFVAEPWGSARRLYRTGDRVRQRPDGRIDFLGRVDFQVKIRGFRVELGEIESGLRRAGDLREVVVVACGEGAYERHLVAYLVAQRGEEPDVDALSATLRATLPGYMIPARWVVVDQLPLTPNGKIDRRAVKEMSGREALVGRHGEEARDDIEVQLTAIWRELLDTEEIGRRDDFFDLGGNSLLAIDCLARLEILLGRRVSLAAFFDAPTIADLANTLRADGIDRRVASAVQIGGGAGETPLFCVGGIHLYQAFARELKSSGKVYGAFLRLEAEWMEDLENGIVGELPSTESTAAAYIDLIKQHRPEGPYRLAGLSYGGIVAYEVAQQLMRRGDRVDALILFDVRLRAALKRAKGPLRRWRYIIRKLPVIGSFRESQRALRDPRRDPAAVRNLLFRDAVQLYESRIAPYDGRVLVCVAQQIAPGHATSDPSLGWARLIRGELTIAECTGDHTGLIAGDNVPRTARAVEAFLASLDATNE